MFMKMEMKRDAKTNSHALTLKNKHIDVAEIFRVTDIYAWRWQVNNVYDPKTSQPSNVHTSAGFHLLYVTMEK